MSSTTCCKGQAAPAHVRTHGRTCRCHSFCSARQAQASKHSFPLSHRQTPPPDPDRTDSMNAAILLTGRLHRPRQVRHRTHRHCPPLHPRRCRISRNRPQNQSSGKPLQSSHQRQSRRCHRHSIRIRGPSSPDHRHRISAGTGRTTWRDNSRQHCLLHYSCCSPPC